MKNIPKLLIWGIGQEYNRALNLLKYWESQHQIEVVGVIDKNVFGLLEIDDWKVYEITSINILNIDYYLVMSEKYYLEILSELLTLGIDKKKVLVSKILYTRELKVLH